MLDMEKCENDQDDKNIPTAEKKADTDKGEVFSITMKNPQGNTGSQRENIFILKDIILLSVAYTVLFTSYFSMENLQSSINKIDGTVSLAAIYTSFIFSSCFLSPLLLTKLQEKLTCLVCCGCYIAYMASQLYPNIYLLIPTAIILGLAAGPLWTAQGIYITKAGTRYAGITGKDPGTIITRFFSIFFMFFQSTQIWGNLISSTVLSAGTEVPYNEQDAATYSCGYRFCMAGSLESRKNTTLDYINTTSLNDAKPSLWKIQALTAFYLSGPVLSFIIIAVAVKPVNKNHISARENSTESPKIIDILSATLYQMRHPYQILLVSLTVWTGIERAFIGADFTAMGAHMVGYTMICYGVCDVVSSTCASYLVKVLGRVSIITLALLTNMSLMIAMILWIPTSEQIAEFFIIAGLWGAADGIWMTQINALYSMLFPKNLEAAFSNCRLWEATGFALSFALSSTLCINAKIIVLTAFLGFGVIGYYIIVLVEKMGGLPRDNEGNTKTIDKLLTKIS